MWAAASRRPAFIVATAISLAPISRQRWTWDAPEVGVAAAELRLRAEAEVVRGASRVAEVAADAIGLGGGLRGGR